MIEHQFLLGSDAVAGEDDSPLQSAVVRPVLYQPLLAVSSLNSMLHPSDAAAVRNVSSVSISALLVHEVDLPHVA